MLQLIWISTIAGLAIIGAHIAVDSIDRMPFSADSQLVRDITMCKRPALCPRLKIPAAHALLLVRAQ